MWSRARMIALCCLCACTAAHAVPTADAAPDAGSDVDAAAAMSDATLDGATGDAAVAYAACPPLSGCRLTDGRGGHCCGGACVDFRSDDLNCGECGAVCPTGMHCGAGLCAYASCEQALQVLSPQTEPWGELAPCNLSDGSRGGCCEGECRASAAFMSDSANCAICGNVCPTGSTCSEGRCLAGTMRVDCTTAGCPSGTTCWADAQCLATDCAGRADGSVCTTTDVHLGSCCAEQCVDAGADRANCGQCGHACPADQVCESAACVTLADCTALLATGQPCQLTTGAAGTCCARQCVDLQSDVAYCGACEIACPGGASCLAGRCESPAACRTDADCPSGTRCDPPRGLGTCVRLDCAGVADETSCSLRGGVAGVCCGGACVEVGDASHCGGCGVSCASGVCLRATDYLGREELTCLAAIEGPGDCAAENGCPASDTCIAGVCVTRSCESDDPLCVTALGQIGSCSHGFGGFCGMMGSPPFCLDLAPHGCGPSGATCNGCDVCIAGMCTSVP